MSTTSDTANAQPSADPGRGMTGAAALTALLTANGLTTVYAYPGTSELALCAAILDQPYLRLIDARGDKEAAFMAAGANLLRRGSAASLLHGARGLTNALGAIADSRRSETPALHIVGEAARPSAPFLPPHAEPALLSSAAAFASAAFDCATIHGFDPEAFVGLATQALAALTTLPHGPVLLGVPQDLLERRFVPASLLTGAPAPRSSAIAGSVDAAARSLTNARRPIILVDDYVLLGGHAAETALGRLAQAIQAPVLQVGYRRGPTLFQRVQRTRVPTFDELYDPSRPEHRNLLNQADLLITIEDRNMYPRVVGTLPTCPKLAVTSNPSATIKNGYLTASDLIVHGDVPAILDRLCAAVAERPTSAAGVACPPRSRLRSHQRARCPSAQALITAIGHGLTAATDLVVVDDGQAFGGLIAQHYNRLPEPLRVLGSHGGFVGSGLPTAVGAALASPASTVVCTLGDQGFTNGVQALGVVGELTVPLLVIMCNNHGSVSLNMQARADGLPTATAKRITAGNHAMNCAMIARGYGLSASTSIWPGCRQPRPSAEAAARELSRTIRDLINGRTPHLLEIVTPNDPDFWHDTWITSGHDQSRSEPDAP